MKDPEDQKQEAQRKRKTLSMAGKVFMVIGILTVLYLFITEVLMRILAYFTVS